MTLTPPPESSPANVPVRAASAASTQVKANARSEFDRWARTYDRSIVQHLLFQPTYRMFMEELYRWRRSNPAPFDLLDIGSGTGTWVAWVAASSLPSRRLVGLDYSAAMCGVAGEKASHIPESPPRFVNGDAEHLPFADGSFDVVTCSNSFHHYPHQAVAIREMVRVLRSGGRLMLIDGFRDNVIGWVVFDVIIHRGESTPEAPVHHVPWSVMRQYFAEAGLSDIHQKKEGVLVPIFLTVGQKS